MTKRLADNKAKRNANLGKSEFGKQVLAREKKNEPIVAAKRAARQAARDANLGKTFTGRQVLAQRKSAADLAKGIAPRKYTPERMAEIKAKAKSQLDRRAAELAAKGTGGQRMAAATQGSASAPASMAATPGKVNTATQGSASAPASVAATPGGVNTATQGSASMPMKKGGNVKKMAKGGPASRRGDGCATKGKTKGRFV